MMCTIHYDVAIGIWLMIVIVIVRPSFKPLKPNFHTFKSDTHSVTIHV